MATKSNLSRSELQRGVLLKSAISASNGFNSIRLVAATLVLFSHAFTLTSQREPLYTLTGQATLGGISVAVFFAISGYLIPISFARSTLSSYIKKRAQRILPALIVAVLFCALVLGPISTSFSLSEYFMSRKFLSFLGNALFFPVGYDLPGVFTQNPISAVNGSLWSLKFEVLCYAFVVLACVQRHFRKQIIFIVWIISYAIALSYPKNPSGAEFYVVKLADLFRFFGAGMMLYLFSEKIVLKKAWGLSALLLTTLSMLTPIFVEVASTLGIYALFVFAYAAPEWFKNLTAKGDISYGVYVYAFPVQQLFVPLSLLFAADSPDIAPYLDTAFSLIPVYLLGLVSWRYVEKPFLSRKRNANMHVQTARREVSPEG